MKQTANNLKQAAKGLILLVAVLGGVVCQAEDLSCEGKGVKAVSRKILIAAEMGKEAVQVNDRRIFISEVLSPQNKMDAEASSAALAIAEASVEISGSTLNGEKLNKISGSGFLYGNRCFALTVRHNVNKGYVQNKAGVIVDGSASPVGAKVEVKHGLTGRGNIANNTGTVVSAGSFSSGLNGDYALIRLDQPAPAKLAKIYLGDDSDLIGTELMTFGLPTNKRSVGGKQIVVDPACKGISKAEFGGIATSCIGAAGHSGGAVAGLVEIDKNGGRAWGIVGMVVEVDSVPAGSSADSQTASGSIQMLNLKDIHPIIIADIKAELAKRPCQ